MAKARRPVFKIWAYNAYKLFFGTPTIENRFTTTPNLFQRKSTGSLSSSIFDSLVEMIKAPSPSPQLLYQIFFCFWTLSSLPTAAAEFHSKYDLIPFLLEACRSALKEKVIRVAIATLRNMVSNAPETTVLPMIGNKTPKLCENFMARKWSDEDIKTDVEFILKELQEKIQSLRYLCFRKRIKTVF